MPVEPLGQQITFSVQSDKSDEGPPKLVVVKPGDTVRSVAARLGHPEEAREIADLNGIRDVNKPIMVPRRPSNPFWNAGGPWFELPSIQNSPIGQNGTMQIKIPGDIMPGGELNVLADDPPPVITGGYAKFDVVDRPGRKGLTRFLGYDPRSYQIPVQFKSWPHSTTWEGRSSLQVEQMIQRLEKMAGRGHFAGAAVGPPAVVRISVTDNNDHQIHLLPFNDQWSTGNPTAPLWRIVNIAWDQDKVRRDETGRRTWQKAVVSAQEYTPFNVQTRSAAQRSRQRDPNRKGPLSAKRKR